jgi:hypothetical protein
MLRILIAASLLAAGAAAGARADEGDRGSGGDGGIRLTGFREVPAVVTAGRGTARLRVRAGPRIDYELTYSGLSSAPQAAHIHVGDNHTNGGVAAFLCGGGSKPACPASGRIAGTVVAADVVGPAAQGVQPGEIGDVVAAIRAGAAYVNVHTTTFPTGEIRGDLRP